MSVALPIETHLPQIVSTLRSERLLVLEAPPGAGKTTRVPRALFDAGLLDEGEVVVLEPRRLAARMAARRVAEEMNEPLGETVGYQVRFDDVSSPRTRIRFVTEGVLTRRALGDRSLKGISAVLLDEFHERHLQGDVGLALLREIQRTTRPDLLIGVMSATLDTEGIASALDAPVVRSPGRRFDVHIEHGPQQDDRPLEVQVSSAVKRLVREGLDGDILVFLPGAAEIRRSAEACEAVARAHELLVLPLHGELSPEEQERAVRPAHRRRLILSTNVAETSVTIDGVVAVIDSGLARVASHSAWSGLSHLQVQRISRASATQRAGRAGRTRPGRCLRLFTEHDFLSRPLVDEPEVRRLDLAQTVLELAGAGHRPETLPWVEAPSAQGLDAARTLLRRLGALDDKAHITPLGRRMASMPVHPRLARLVIEGESRGAGEDATFLAAILGERDVFGRDGGKALVRTDSDPIETLERVRFLLEGRGRVDRARREGASSAALLAVDRARKQLERQLEPSRVRAHDSAEALRIALLAAFPDRVARRRTGAGDRLGQRELVFAQGGSARLGDESGVDAEFVVAVDAQQRKEGMRGGVLVRSASAIEEEWLVDLFPDDFDDALDIEWNSALERAEAISRLRFGALVLEERRVDDTASVALSTRLYEQVKSKGVAAFAAPELLDTLLARVSFVAQAFPDASVSAPTEANIDRALRAVCEGRRSFGELRDANLVEELMAQLVEHRADFERLAPTHLTLPRGRRVKVHYEAERPPWIESRLQDFFGLKAAPSLGGRVPVVVHLLAPNQRAVQVTTDLEGFWTRHYPALRQQLMRRYPRHAWPEDPFETTR